MIKLIFSNTIPSFILYRVPNFHNMLEEVDKLILRCKEEQEMKDFLEKNIYPTRTRDKYIYKDVPPIRESPLPDIPIQNETPFYSHIQNKLNNIDNLIYSLKTKMNHSPPESCPICICDINDTNIIIPSCGHKTCIHCFVSNLTHNKHTGHLCSVCRTTIVN